MNDSRRNGQSPYARGRTWRRDDICRCVDPYRAEIGMHSIVLCPIPEGVSLVAMIEKTMETRKIMRISSVEVHSLHLDGQRKSPYMALFLSNRTMIIKNKRPSFPASHKTDRRPLLPSGPGGVEQRLVAQDLTSQKSVAMSIHLVLNDGNFYSACMHQLVEKPTLFSGAGISGADRDRTDDLFVANEALSQLSYSPAKPL
jgi:hypothetical protein